MEFNSVFKGLMQSITHIIHVLAAFQRYVVYTFIYGKHKHASLLRCLIQAVPNSDHTKRELKSY